MVQGKNAANEARTGVREPLTPDVVVPKAHQNNRSYVSSADLPLDNLAWLAVTRRTLKATKLSKLWGGGGRVLARVWALARDNMVILRFCVHTSCM